MRHALGIILLFIVGSAQTVAAGTVSVFADVNMFGQTSTVYEGNDQVALNMLGEGTNIYFDSRFLESVSGSYALHNFYSSLDGVTSGQFSTEITSTALSNTDLLVLDVGFANESPYSESEMLTISDFLEGGGNVAVIAEIYNIQGPMISWNNLLESMGTSIRFVADYRCCAGLHQADTILDTSLTQDVDQFTIGGASFLAGGIAAIQDQGNTVVAYESVIPIPATVWLLGSALAGLGWIRRRQTA